MLVVVGHFCFFFNFESFLVVCDSISRQVGATSPLDAAQRAVSSLVAAAASRSVSEVRFVSFSIAVRSRLLGHAALVPFNTTHSLP